MFTLRGIPNTLKKTFIIPVWGLPKKLQANAPINAGKKSGIIAATPMIFFPITSVLVVSQASHIPIIRAIVVPPRETNSVFFNAIQN